MLFGTFEKDFIAAQFNLLQVHIPHPELQTSCAGKWNVIIDYVR